MKISTKLAGQNIFISLITMLTVFLIINQQIKEHAIRDAEEQAHLILDQKQALVEYVSKELAPQLQPTAHSGNKQQEVYSPVTLSSSEINRALTHYQTWQGHSYFEFREATINAENPQLEADSYERTFLLSLRTSNPKDRAFVIEQEGVPYLLHMRAKLSGVSSSLTDSSGQAVEFTSQTGSNSTNAPGITKPLAQTASVLSLKIPLQNTQQQAVIDFMPLCFMISIILLISFGFQWCYVREQITIPLEQLSHKVVSISTNEAQLGETVQSFTSEEINNFAHAFNRLSVALKNEKEVLDLRVQEQTRELSEAYNQLHQQEEKVRLLINSKSEAIYSIDLSGKCIFCNDSCVELLGYSSKEDLLGRNMHFVIQQLPHEQETTHPEQCNILKNIHSSKKIHKENDVFWSTREEKLLVEWWAYPIIRESKVIGAVITFINIDEQRREQAKTMRANQLAALGEMAAGVAHEINNPINGIINYAQLLKNRKGDDAFIKGIVNGIIKEGWRIANIVTTLLAHARDDSQMESIRLKDVVQGALSLIGKQIEKDGIHIQIDVPAELALVIGSKQKLEQVLLNLLSNSRYALTSKYHDRHDNKKIVIMATEEMVRGSRHVVFSVKDFGQGIEGDHLNKVASPFFTTKPAGVGTGLGLSISHEIIKEHGGQMNIQSEFGEYTFVEIVLPAIESAG